MKEFSFNFEILIAYTGLQYNIIQVHWNDLVTQQIKNHNLT